MSRIPTVDSHQHFWRLSRGDYDWLTPDLTELYRDFEPEDLEPLSRAAGVDYSVVVQAAPTLDETRFLLDLASAHDWIAGVIGWIDMESDSADKQIYEWAGADTSRKLCGVRPMIQDIDDPAWMLGDRLAPAFEALVATDLRFDALVRPQHLAYLDQLLSRYPKLRVVVDHGAKPDIALGEFDAWAPQLAEIASHPNTTCKLSGLVTEASSNWTTDSLRPYVDQLLESFGAKRLLWGSDWPVVELAGGYRSWRDTSEALLAGLSDPDRRAIFGGNAIEFYGLDVAPNSKEDNR